MDQKAKILLEKYFMNHGPPVDHFRSKIPYIAYNYSFIYPTSMIPLNVSEHFENLKYFFINYMDSRCS